MYIPPDGSRVSDAAVIVIPLCLAKKKKSSQSVWYCGNCFFTKDDELGHSSGRRKQWPHQDPIERYRSFEDIELRVPQTSVTRTNKRDPFLYLYVARRKGRDETEEGAYMYPGVRMEGCEQNRGGKVEVTMVSASNE